MAIYKTETEVVAIAQDVYTSKIPDILARASVGPLSEINPSSPAPTKTGLYLASQSGTYTNWGGISVDTTTGVNLIYYNSNDNTFTKSVVTVPLADYVSNDDLTAITGKNLYNSATDVSGFINGDSGDINTATASYQKTSDFIRIEAGQTYTISGRSQGGASGIVFYTSSKSKITQPPPYKLVGGDSNGTFTAPATAAFCRITAQYEASDNKQIQLEKGSVATAYEPYNNINSVSQIKGYNFAASSILGADGIKEADDYINDILAPQIQAINAKVEASTKPDELIRSFKFVQSYLPQSFTSSFTTGVASYTANGVTVDNSAYTNANNFKNYIVSNFKSASAKYRRETIVKVEMTDFAISIGVHDANQFDLYLKFMSGSVNTAALFFYKQVSNPAINYFDAGQVRAQVGDVLKITTAFMFNVFTASLENMTDGSKAYYTYTYPLVTTPPLLPAVNSFDFNWFEGKSTLQSDTFFIAKSDTVYIGDSITRGYAVGGNDALKTFAGQAFGRLSDNWTMIAAPGGKASDLLQCIEEIKSCTGHVAVVMIGANDVLQGTPVSNYIDTMKKIIYPLVNMGKYIILCTITPVYASYAAGATAVPFNDALRTEFAGKVPVIVDVYNALVDSNGRLKSQYDSGDAVHPNAAAATLINATIQGYDNSGLAYGNGTNNAPDKRYLITA